MKIAAYAMACVVLIGGACAALADAPAAAPAPASGATLLQLKYKVGQVLTYHMVFDISGTFAQNGGNPIPIEQTMDMTATQTVKSIDPLTGAATVTSDIVSNSKKLTINGNPAPNSNPQAAPQETLSTTAVVEPSGKVDSFHMDKGDLNNPMMTMDANSPMVGPFYGSGKPVSVGDSWTKSTTRGQMGVNYDTTYTLASLTTINGDQIASIGSNLSGNISNKVTNPPNTNMNGTFTGTQSVALDNTIGIVQSETSSTHTMIVIATDTSQPPPQGTTPPTPVNEKIDITQKITVSLVSSK